MLVATAGAPAMEAVRQLVEKLDRPPESLTVHLFFLRSRIGKATDTSGKELPAAGLRQVVVALAQNGFADPKLVAPVVVTTDEDQWFESSSRHQPCGECPVTEDLSFYVRGRARLQSAEDIVQVNINAVMKGKYQDSGTLAAGDVNFEVNTTIATELGNYVILAAAPSSTAQGDAIALAVKVTRD
jgi:hypothetical protein